MEHKFGSDWQNSTQSVILFCICATVAYCILLRLMGIVCSGIFSGLANSYWVDGIRWFIMSGFIIIVLSRVNKKYVLVEWGTGFWSGIRTSGFLFVIILLSILSSITTYASAGTLQPPIMILGFVLSSFAVGLAEELLHRGLILNVLADRFGRDSAKGIWLSVLISGVIFGLFHLANLFTDGRTVLSVIVQSLYAIGTGIYFGAIYVRCNNLWVLIFLHALNDFAVEMEYGVWGIGSETAIANSSGVGKILYVSVYIILAAFLLRRSKLTLLVKGEQ